MIVHELGLLDPRFPRELRRAAAFAALNGERESAVHTARSFVERDPGRAGRAAEALSGLPILHDLYFEILQSAKPEARPQPPPRQASPPAQGTSTWTLVRVLPFLLLALLRFAASCPQDRPAPPPSQDRYPPIESFRQPTIPNPVPPVPQPGPPRPGAGFPR